mmetsp:Transcript_39402/g.92015  ORF Transcript_39402/g.92015 Transcript_39402/m.92015 type:complete len:933 (+) Transcript_39402:644-3442(+)|eukprot:CAMPEP_0113302586 /NCGR_PEP_ID=MMETSP0010_2-20120614/3351_1 /TAXON_ID=216773 ORGANISM="Corethron hystrix, Strain 308" /NCGR_SAMPLE_ID=MMETSP0010_2 /ASSEMBLY_ACC=CAM_ASM_000155 /LENGTH=932 /DNA_ID=CAMNT_0000156429 /DNA_START=535 /DNA_END=3333 /DNA_ORIENTATION=- /assembly_acc=CAM_ASM_000155
MVSLPSDSLGISHLIRAYQVNGHFAAQLDPLRIHSRLTFPQRHKDGEVPFLSHTFHGFSESDLDRPLNLKGRSTGGNVGFLEELAKAPSVTLRQVMNTLEKTYCGTLAVEYMHIGDTDKCNWMRNRVENPRWHRYSKEKKLHILERLCFADTFENFLGNKFNTTKRFGLDGGESVVPGLKDLIDRATDLGCHSFIIGMPHRGRLNVLANVMRKPMPLIFKEFQGSHYDIDDHTKDHDRWGMSGDVKYHLGSSMDRTYPDGRRVHLSLLANPSHLECVNPLVAGKARAKQFYCGNRPEDVRAVVPILLHGDAAFAGQGVVYETMQMAGVEDFDVGGTIHVIVNNQVGFTTNPINSRSTPYCTDLGKAFNCPIFHCNGDDPLAVSMAMETAIEWRHEFGTDVVIDVVCYRRNGHNELDNPSFTQPLLYDKIRKHKSTLDVFQDRLIEEDTLTKEECNEVRRFVQTLYESDFEASKTYKTEQKDWLSSHWNGFKSPAQMSRIRPTGVDIDILKNIGKALGSVPEDFKLHRQIMKIFQARAKSVETGKGIDWGTAELLAFGSLLLEGNHVRITGQDVQRGTFSHRHAVVKDQKTEHEYTPLNNIAGTTIAGANLEDCAKLDTQAMFTARNSILSEFAVLGFEQGYSLENPNALILWEAQFGDFSNGAQVMLDQFISSGEDKWMRQSGICLLLPHGYDGQGAEHSSCRLERFLQMSDEDPHFIPEMSREETMQVQRHNWQVVNCTTPANYYHCLRRQIHRDFRKPLIVMSPKNLLRHKKCVSDIEEMGSGTFFKSVLSEQDKAISSEPNGVKTLVFCTGQIYYELLAEREKTGRTDVALVRLEQISPFAFDRVAEQVKLYPNAEIVWAQQEPKNMGAYSYVDPRIMTATRDLNGEEKRARYVGRKVSAAPATGMPKVHNQENLHILIGVFGEPDLEP